MKKRYYVIPMVSITATVHWESGKVENARLSWFDGQFGAMAVFTDKRKAQRAAKKFKIDAPLIVVEWA